MTGLPDADPNLEASSERRCDSVSDADLLDDSAVAEEDGFNFWRDVIGDDIVCAGVVYSSDEWTHDREGDVRRLTVAEKSVRNADRPHLTQTTSRSQRHTPPWRPSATTRRDARN